MIKTGTLGLTPFKLRLWMVALLGIGVFIGSGGVAFAQSAEEVSATLSDFVLVVAAAMVFFMQAGFAFLGAGLIRSKNTVNYMTKSFLDFCIASLGFWAFGFALMMGGGGAAGIIGGTGFFLIDFKDTELVGWLFQMVFAGTAATIIAGAMAERTRINAYFAYSFIVGALVYPIYGHWAWSDEGWLTQDRAGLRGLRRIRGGAHDRRLPGASWRDSSRSEKGFQRGAPSSRVTTCPTW